MYNNFFIIIIIFIFSSCSLKNNELMNNNKFQEIENLNPKIYEIDNMPSSFSANEIPIFSVKNISKNIFLGSAFSFSYLNNTYILTSRHVIEASVYDIKNKRIILYDSLNNREYIVVNYYFELNKPDIALLKVNELDLIDIKNKYKTPKLLENESKIKLNENLFIPNYSQFKYMDIYKKNNTFLFTRGYISAIQQNEIFAQVDFFNVGGSGSPIINNDYKVIGFVNQMLIENNQFRNIVTGLNNIEILKFIKEYNETN